MLSLHTDAATFNKNYNVFLQSKYCADRSMCMVGNAPTFEAVTVAFGKETTIQWIATQIVELSEYCGVKNKINQYQTGALSKVISEEYCHLKVTEFMLFLHDFKLAKITDRKGDVIGFYGSAAPEVIAKALREWERMRVEEIQQYIRSRPSVEELVDEYRNNIKNAIWMRIYALKHSEDEEKKERILAEFKERGISETDYWGYINRCTSTYRREKEKEWSETYGMPWR